MTTFRIILSMLVVLAMSWGLLLVSPSDHHRLLTAGQILLIAIAGAIIALLLARRQTSHPDG